MLVLVLILQIIAAMHAYVQRPRPSWVREWPAMVVLAVSQIFWARAVEEAVVAGDIQVIAWTCKTPKQQTVAGGLQMACLNCHDTTWSRVTPSVTYTRAFVAGLTAGSCSSNHLLTP